MKSELSFLMDLFLNEDVPSEIKKVVAKRIREVEEAVTKVMPMTLPIVPRGTPVVVDGAPIATITASAQAPSMQRIIQAHPDIPVKPAQPATAAAAAALNQRTAIIQSGMSEKPEPGRTSPRKF